MKICERQGAGKGSRGFFPARSGKNGETGRLSFFIPFCLWQRATICHRPKTDPLLLARVKIESARRYNVNDDNIAASTNKHDVLLFQVRESNDVGCARRVDVSEFYDYTRARVRNIAVYNVTAGFAASARVYKISCRPQHRERYYLKYPVR